MDEGAGDLLAAVKPEAGLAQGGVDIGGYGRGLTFAALASGHGHAFFHGNLKGLAVVGAEKGRGDIGLEPEPGEKFLSQDGVRRIGSIASHS